MKNKGITLVVLVITIIVIIVLVGTIVGSATIAIDDSKKTNLAQDLLGIEEAIETYYVSNNTLPVNETPVYTLQTLKDLLVLEKYTTPFEEEVSTNSDNDSNFFIVDLAKIGVKSTGRGAASKGETDIFVVSEKNMNVYYLKGVTAGGVTYFSLTPTLINITKIKQPKPSDDNETGVKIGGKIKAEKDKKLWTDSLNINLSLDFVNDTDNLFMVVGTAPERDITIITKEAKKISVPKDLTAEEKTSLLARKEITFIRKTANVETVRISVNLSNLDMTAPTIQNATVKGFSDFNNITIDSTETESGFGEIRYEYLQKKNSDGVIVDAYKSNVANLQNVFSASYMKEFGKKAESNVIKLPKYVSKVQIYVFDKSGNYVIRTVTIDEPMLINEPKNNTEENPSNANKTPYVPMGFTHTEGETNTGYVIKDATLGNEFVWIPVANIDDFKRTAFKGENITTVYTETVPDAIINSIKAYGGFYIARYESGTTITTADAASRNISGTPISKQGQMVWNYIDWNNSLANSKAMYNTSEIATDLIYGTIWDTVCNWLVSSGNKTQAELLDSSSWGNYSNNTVTGHGTLQTTGYSETWKANNIYDLSGNAFEWNHEFTNTNRMARGGAYNCDSSTTIIQRGGRQCAYGYNRHHWF